jgi:hypothetical protein
MAVEIMMVIKLILCVVFKWLVDGVITHFMYNNEQTGQNNCCQYFS